MATLCPADEMDLLSLFPVPSSASKCFVPRLRWVDSDSNGLPTLRRSTGMPSFFWLSLCDSRKVSVCKKASSTSRVQDRSHLFFRLLETSSRQRTHSRVFCPKLPSPISCPDRRTCQARLLLPSPTCASIPRTPSTGTRRARGIRERQGGKEAKKGLFFPAKFDSETRKPAHGV